MDTSSDSLSPVELLAEEFLDRQQRGENPTIEDYCQRHPELAEEIKDVFEGFLLIEDLKPGSHDVSESFSSERRIDGTKLDRIGDYRIIREVGRGGMGVVFEAEQESLRRRVALKVLPRQIASDPKALQRFQQEARAAARMHHTNIVPVFEVGDDEEHVFYAMQLIQGQGLDVVIDDLRRLRNEHSGLPASKSEAAALADRSHAQSIAASLVMGEFEQQDLLAEPDGTNGSQEHDATVMAETMLHSSGSTASAVLPGQSEITSAEKDRGGYFVSVARIGHQTAGALAYAHARGIIHRDIKPSNLLLDTAGVVWVTDFGLAKTGDEALTHTGDILGTLRYMSPERFKGQCDVRADVYSLGLTLYEMLVLKPGFSSPDRLKLIELVTKTEPPTPRSIDARIPRDLETIILKSIDKDPRRRYQSADDLSDDLERFIQDEPIQARRISLVERFARWSRRNKSLAASLAVLATVIMVVAIGSTIAAGYFRNLSRSLEASEQSLTAAVRDLEDNQARLVASKQQEKQRADERDRAAQSALLARDEARQQKLSSRRSEYRSTLFAAQRALATVGGYTRGRELLDGLQPQAGEEDLRGIEFHLLNSLPDISGSRTLRTDLRGFRDDLGFSPDGRYLASADRNAVVVIDVTTGEINKRLVGHTELVRRVLWKSNGAELISAHDKHGDGDSSGTICVWDVERGIQVQTFPGESTFALSPDETRIVCGTDVGQVQIRDVLSGDLLESFEGHQGRIHRVDWSVRNQIASCGADGTVRLWDLTTSEEHLLIDSSGTGPSDWSTVRFNPDGSQLAASTHRSATEPVVIWDVEHLEAKRMLPVGQPYPRGMPTFAWSQDGTRLAGLIWPGAAIEIWDPNTGQRVRRFDGLPSQPRSCSWSPDDRQLASRTMDGVVQVWDVEPPGPQIEFAGLQGLVYQLSWSPDGRHFATAGEDGAVRIWDVRSKQESYSFDRQQSRRGGVAWHPQQNVLASWDLLNVVIWEWHGTDSLQKLNLAPSIRAMGFSEVVWSPDGTQFATAEGVRGNARGFVKTYHYDAGTFVPSREFAQFSANSLSWEQDAAGTSFLAAAGGGAVKVWNSETGEEVLSEEIFGRGRPYVSLSPQADRIAIAALPDEDAFGDADGRERIVWIVDLATQRELQLLGHAGDVRSLNWSADGTRLLTAGGVDGTCCLWNAATGRQLLTIGAPGDAVVQAARFSPDDLQIVMAGRGIQLLDATPSYTAHLSERVLPMLAGRIDAGPTVEDLVLRGRIHAKLGKWDEAAADFEMAAQRRAPDVGGASWFETAWWLAGPYPESLGDVQPPEEHLDPLQPIPAADAVGESTEWRVIGVSDALDLGAYLAAAEHVSAYVQTRIYTTEARTVGLLLGADDHVWVRCNDQEVHMRTANREAVRDDEAVEIRLEPGWNTLLVKVANDTAAHGLFARLSDDPRELADAFTRNEQWQPALKWADLALARNPDASALQLLRGRAALQMGERQIANESFDRLIESAEHKDLEYRRVAELYLEHARTSQDAEQAAASLDRAREFYAQLLSSGGFNERDAAGLADVLLTTMSQSTWTVLTPERGDMHSAGGATLERLDDGSILAGGTNPLQEVYRITTRPQKQITCVGLETMPHPRLPSNRSGRSQLGNFLISRFGLAIQDNATGETREIEFAGIASDFAAGAGGSSHVENMLGRGPGPHWTAWGDLENPHRVVFELQEPISVPENCVLQFTIDCRDPNWPQYALGRFRLSISDSATAFDDEQQRLAALSVANGWDRLAAAYRLMGDETALAALLERRPEAAVGNVALAVEAAAWAEDTDPTQVREAVEQALQANPGNFDVMTRIQEICSNARSWQAGAAGLQTLFDDERENGASNQQLAEILRRRGALEVRAGEWQSAAVDYGAAAQLDPAADNLEWMAAAALFAYADDAAGHREHCWAMLERFRPQGPAGDSSELDTNGGKIVKCMMLLEQGQEFESVLAPETFPVRSLLASLDGVSRTDPRWFKATRALWAFRNPAVGDPAEALQWVDLPGPETGRVGLTQLTVQALFHARAGNVSGARASLDQAKLLMETEHGLKWLDTGRLDGTTILLNSGLIDHDLLIPEVLRREAERLLQAGAEKEAEEAEPANNVGIQP